MEQNSDVKVQLTDYICDDCSQGVMRYNEKIYFTYPERYEHKCEHCGTIKDFQCKYPKFIYTRIDTL